MANDPLVDPPPADGYPSWNELARQRAINDIHAALESNRTPDTVPAKVPTAVFTAKNPLIPKPNPWSPERTDQVDDPHMELAVQLMQMRYPEVFKNVGKIVIGSTHNLPDTIADIGDNFGNEGGKQIRLSPSTSFNHALDTLRHELAHTVGYRDKGPLNAYDVGRASSRLHSDIPLETPIPFPKRTQ